MARRHLLFIHGFLENASMWKYVLPHLSKKDYVIDLPELPGHGQNTQFPKEISATSYCRNILEQVQIEDEDSVFIIAHSMGGYLSATLATMIPTQVSGLCLFHSKAGADNAQKISERHRAIEAARDNKDLYVRAMLTGTFHPDNRARCVPELESMIKDAQKLPFATIENSQRVMIDRPDRIADMRARKFPLYYFLGDQDSSLPADIMQNELMQMPGAVAHVLQGIGHMGHIESTRKSAEFIQRVLLADT